jgi:glycosyltransferase involved in cell wall biosynthesis
LGRTEEIIVSPVMPDKAPLSIIILTYQEEANLGVCLENVCDWAGDVFVVDSYSTDRTIEIARNKGVKFWQNSFENMAQQRNWALDHLPFSFNWVLFLDADELLTEELKQELTEVLPRLSQEVSGLYMRRQFIWLGRWLKRAGMYKWILRTVRRDRARVEMAGRREYMRVQGTTKRLQNDMLHDDHKGVGDWIVKHNKFASQEARELLESASGKKLTDTWQTSRSNAAVETESARVVKLRHFWNRLPLFVRPPLSFFIKYILMLGFMDGIPGIIYYFLHDFWYPFLVDVKYLELRSKMPTLYK